LGLLFGVTARDRDASELGVQLGVEAFNLVEVGGWADLKGHPEVGQLRPTLPVERRFHANRSVIGEVPEVEVEEVELVSICVRDGSLPQTTAVFPLFRGIIPSVTCGSERLLGDEHDLFYTSTHTIQACERLKVLVEGLFWDAESESDPLDDHSNALETILEPKDSNDEPVLATVPTTIGGWALFPWAKR
jgi:hypothetical protein